MRLLALTLLLFSSGAAMAQESSENKAGDKPVSYYIAPGVLVTSFYADAEKATGGVDHLDNAIPVSTPMQDSYSPGAQTMNLEAPSYWNTQSTTPASYTTSRPQDTSNRFYMQQGGKTMTADDFDRWVQERGLKIKGSRVVRVE